MNDYVTVVSEIYRPAEVIYEVAVIEINIVIAVKIQCSSVGGPYRRKPG